VLALARARERVCVRTSGCVRLCVYCRLSTLSPIPNLQQPGSLRLTHPPHAATLCNYAYLLHSDKRMGEAREVFLRAYDTNPEHPWVRSNQHLFA